MTRIRDFEGHVRPFFFFRRFHPFRSFHNQKFEQLFLERANIAPLWSVFLHLNWKLHWLFGRFAGASDHELVVSPAFLTVQESMEEVVGVKEKRRA
jgi:hypothetical protein